MNFENDKSKRSVSIWIEAARDGDSIAAQEIFNRYFQRLVSVSKNRVRRLERVEDSEDAAIQAMHDFLQGCADGKFPDVEDRNSLWPLLLTMVLNKSKKQIRRQNAKKRGGGIIRGESVFGEQNGGGGLADWAVDDASIESDLEGVVQKFRSSLDELERQIFDLKLQQFSNRQIAKQLERPPRTIDRKVGLINANLNQMIEKEMADL